MLPPEGQFAMVYILLTLDVVHAIDPARHGRADEAAPKDCA